MDLREKVGRRGARLFKDGMLVNLGIGMPTALADYIPEGIQLNFQTENGAIGFGPAPEEGYDNPYLTNAGGSPLTILPGGCYFDSATSFALIRGGHVDATVLGVLEVDEKGNLANYMVPGKLVPGMGGAMDLAIGAKMVVVVTEHCDKTGNPKILKRCKLPLTAKESVHWILSELALMEVTKEGLVLREIAPDTTIEEVRSKTEADLIISADGVETVKYY
ncbi:3-oxoacid CoA-transferase subunit B [Desulfosporosinus shakirovi]|uniref:3-oxoacid CoA-transferase subunit B n=1 Tax=Desulfosporosinus shakirovi TaxID=2885154 RepID=UPI001E38E779|nr:3-oxoacid CoA-transferase subunit B [Desulfosporosinus sp. SRJS8]MCB8817852.1 3-oxoacid CoA-transferase subunit B [Desulfosporosinus sp. SRJS8]